MTQTRVAVIGAGHLGRIHTRLLLTQPDVQVVGVVDPVSQARSQVAAEFGVPTFAHHAEIGDRCDAAIIATVTTQHHAVGMELLRRGLHLLIEKPMATSSQQALELVAAAAERGLTLQVGHVEQFNPAFTSAQAMVGQPLYIEARRTSGYTGRSTDIGVILDLMVHDLDLVLLLAHSNLEQVQAIGTTVIGPHEDMAQARLSFENGCVANLSVSRTSFVAQRTMQIYTPQGCANLDFASGITEWVGISESLRPGQFQVSSLTEAERARLRDRLFVDYLPRRTLNPEPRNAILDEQRDFIGAIVEGRAPRVSGLWALQVLTVCEQIRNEVDEWQNRYVRCQLPNRPGTSRMPDSGTESKPTIPFPSTDPNRRRAG